MPEFRYQALNADEQPVAGEIQADSVAAAISQLGASGLTVQSIGYATGEKLSAQPPSEAKTPAVASTQQPELEKNLARIIERGRAIAPALHAYVAEMPSSRSRRQLVAVIRILDSGNTAEAASALQRVPAYWIPLISAATASKDAGQMLQTFLREAEQSEELSRQWRQTFIYPVCILGGASAVMFFLSVLVIPVFRKVFAEFGLKLPVLTQAVLTVAAWIASGQIILMAVAAIIAALVLTRVVPILLPAPLRDWLSDRFGKLLSRSTALAQFSQFLADLLEAGFEMATALRLAGLANGSSRLARAASRLADQIDIGRDRDDDSNRKILTATVLHAVRADLPNQSRTALLREISRCYAERARIVLSWTRGVIEPVSIMLVGFLVGAVVIGLFLPLLSLIQGLS